MRAPACLALALLAGGCATGSGSAHRSAADEGYLLGEADAVKQLYWARQALEAPRGNAPAGRTEYYTWEDPGATLDGRRLAPEAVSVPVFIAAPAPAGGPVP